MAKEKKKKIHVKILLEIEVPKDLLENMDEDDRHWLNDLSRLGWLNWETSKGRVYLFKLEVINRLRGLFRKYGYVLAFPSRKEIRQYGLSYSGDSLEIEKVGDAFKIIQYFPDGEEKTFVIPQNVVFRVYYTIKRWFENHPDTAEVETPILWEEICKEFQLKRYFRNDGKFEKSKFFGDRKQYFYFAYYPMKILDHIGKISYYGKYVELLE